MIHLPICRPRRRGRGPRRARRRRGRGPRRARRRRGRQRAPLRPPTGSPAGLPRWRPRPRRWRRRRAGSRLGVDGPRPPRSPSLAPRITSSMRTGVGLNCAGGASTPTREGPGTVP
ncbi:MAG: hypothetical protein EB084_14420 [Proteobacteria bacterium]|nr:hypothetical protein [Pseudomonadota bacterium]